MQELLDLLKKADCKILRKTSDKVIAKLPRDRAAADAVHAQVIAMLPDSPGIHRFYETRTSDLIIRMPVRARSIAPKAEPPIAPKAESKAKKATDK